MKKRLDENNLITKEYLDQKLTNYPTKQDLKKEIKDVVRKKDLEVSLRSMENRITRKLNQVVDFFDDEVQPLKNRVGRIENHLHLPQLSS